MTRRALAYSLVVFAAFAASGCSGALEHDEALRVIQSSPLIRPTDNVSVEAISRTNEAEAIVRAAVAGRTTNLKFRRFDKGWAWEFVETNSGSWIAPQMAIAQIREEQRTLAAAEWAEQNTTAYGATAKTMYYVALYHAPNPTEAANVVGFERLKKLQVAGLVERVKSQPDLQDRLAVLKSDYWTDAWGTKIGANYNSKDGSTLLVSFGPDKVQGNEDDLICLNTFRPDYEDGRSVWQHDKAWRLPENLGAVIEPFFNKQNDKIEYSKVVKP